MSRPAVPALTPRLRRIHALSPDRRALLVTAGLAVAATLPPIALTGLPGAFAVLGPLPAALAVVAVLTLAPALVGLAMAILGLDRVLTSCRTRGDQEHEQVILRIFIATAMLAYVLVLAVAAGDDTVSRSLVVVSLALGGAWLFLLHVILSPSPSDLRRHLAMAADIGFLSAFLHVGGGLAAAWYPLYLAAIFYNGFRLGLRALVVSAGLSAGGFALTVATTPFWQHQALLSAGMALALLLLPACVARLIRAVASSRAAVTEANAARGRLLAVMGRELRTPLDAMIRMSAAGGPSAVSASALLSRISDILDLSQIETGAFAPEIRAFDLHDLVNEALAVLRRQAAAKGLMLALRVDPNLPYRLRGWPQQLSQILHNVVAHAIAATEKGRIRVGLDEIARNDQAIQLRIIVRDDGKGLAPGAREAIFDPFGADLSDPDSRAPGALGLAIVKQLVELMGGRIAIDGAPGKGSLFTIAVPLTIDHSAAAAALDLGNRAVLIVTEDTQFAGDLAEPLNAWNADARWIGASEAALAYVAGLDPFEDRPVLIVDGRAEILPALTFAHRAVAARAAHPPFVLFVAEAAWVDRLTDLADGELAGLLPAPLTDRMLGNALHALPLAHPAAQADAPTDFGVREVAAALADDPSTAALPHRPAEAEPAAARAATFPMPRRHRAEPASAIEAIAAAPGQESASAAQRPLRVLVAAGDRVTRNALERTLARQGHRVDSVGDGEAALMALDGDAVDVVLMDVAMPRLGGCEAVRLYRMAHSEGPRLPIIALVADSGPETERRCREAGMDAVLSTPIEARALLAAIADVVAVVGDLAARSAGVPSTVTPIAAHPRFVADTAAPVDERAVEALRALGAGSDFFRDVIETFRLDAREIVQRISQAAAAADARGFAEGVQALRSCAANVGGARLCELLLPLRQTTARELRQQGTAHVQRLTAELDKLDAVLLDSLQQGEATAR